MIERFLVNGLNIFFFEHDECKLFVCLDIGWPTEGNEKESPHPTVISLLSSSSEPLFMPCLIVLISYLMVRFTFHKKEC